MSEINTLKELRKISRKWIEYYNNEKLHQSLGYRTPDELRYGGDILNTSNN